MEIFRKYQPSTRFFKNFRQKKRDFWKISTKIEILRNFHPKSFFLQLLTIVEIYENFDQNQDISKISTKIEIFGNFGKIENFVNIEIFQKFRP